METERVYNERNYVFFFVKVSDEPVVEGRKDDVNLKWINSVSYTMSGSDESKSDVLGLQQYI